MQRNAKGTYFTVLDGDDYWIDKNKLQIHERDAAANDKVELGHLEGDLAFHKGNQSKNIGVMVDKKSQKDFLVFNGSKRKNTVAYKLSRKINSIPTHLIKTLIY